MSRGENSLRKARSGSLGALRWALTQQSDDACANHLLIKMGALGNTSFKCHASISRLAKEMGCSERTVQRKIRYLLMRGYVEDLSDVYRWRQTQTYRLCPSADDG